MFLHILKYDIEFLNGNSIFDSCSRIGGDVRWYVGWADAEFCSDLCVTESCVAVLRLSIVCQDFGVRLAIVVLGVASEQELECEGTSLIGFCRNVILF
jgi:hypothetical protein